MTASQVEKRWMMWFAWNFEQKQKQLDELSARGLKSHKN